MVSPQQKEVFRVFDLVRQQQADGFQRLLASVYIVPEEQVVALRWEASIFKKPQQIIVLPVDVTWSDKQEREQGKGQRISDEMVQLWVFDSLSTRRWRKAAPNC